MYILIFLAFFFLPFSVPEQRNLNLRLVSFFFLILSLVIANYFAWKELYERFLGKLKIDFTANNFINPGFYDDGNITERAKWNFEFDITNSTDRTYYLEDWSLEPTQMDNELISFNNLKKLVINKDGNINDSIQTPFKIPSKDRKLLRGVIPVKLLSSGPENIAQKVGKLESFSVIIKLNFKDLDGMSEIKEYKFTDNFNHFKNHAMNHWEMDEKLKKLYLIANQKCQTEGST